MKRTGGRNYRDTLPLGSQSKWSSHNEYRNNALTNNFVAWKHCHVVAAVMSRAQIHLGFSPTQRCVHDTARSSPAFLIILLRVVHRLPTPRCSTLRGLHFLENNPAKAQWYAKLWVLFVEKKITGAQSRDTACVRSNFRFYVELSMDCF